MSEPDHLCENECPLCGGEGIVDYYVSGINYHNGSLNEHWRICPQCKGSGTEWAASVPATEQEIMEAAYDPTLQPYDEPFSHKEEV